MDASMSSARLVEVMNKTFRQWEEQREAGRTESGPRPPFTIAVSRETGANGSLIARAVKKEKGRFRKAKKKQEESR